MELTHILAFNAALLAAMISPGPAFLICVQTALSSGARAGLALGAGLGLMAALWTALALLGLDIVFTLFPWAYLIVKIGGALYLLHLAYRMWHAARKPLAKAQTPPARAFRHGVMVNLLNPKSVLFAGAVLVVIFPADLNMAQTAFIVANHLLMELLFYSTLAFCMSRPAVSARYLGLKLYLDRISAAVLGALGLRLLIAR